MSAFHRSRGIERGTSTGFTTQKEGKSLTTCIKEMLFMEIKNVSSHGSDLEWWRQGYIPIMSKVVRSYRLVSRWVSRHVRHVHTSVEETA